MAERTAPVQACTVAQAVAVLPASRAYALAFSGGLDSMVLLHALWQRQQQDPALRIRALHVNHGLQDSAASWARHCAELCACWAVPFVELALRAAPPIGNLEAWAREQRYAALLAELIPGEVLLTAHHQRDQAETILLNLLRGSGMRGLAGMRGERDLGDARLQRPLLQLGRAQLEDYARHHGLDWDEDPSNADMRFDRNFLRAEILPRLRQRFPAAEAGMARSASLLREALELQAEDLQSYMQGEALSLTRLVSLSPQRRHALLLQFLSLQGLPWPRYRMREEIWRQMLRADADRQPRIAWPGAELRRYRDGLYALKPLVEDAFTAWQIDAEGSRQWPFGGSVRWQLTGPGRIDVYRGGETLRWRDGRRHRLKQLFQQAGVPPWQRRRMPLLFLGDELISVGRLWRASDAPSLRWEWLDAGVAND